MDRWERFKRLRAILKDVADLEAAASVLSWDEQTYMPPGGAQARGEQQATLRRMAHERFIHPEVGELLAALADLERESDPASFEAALLRVTRREYERAVRLPPELVQQITQASSAAFHAWVQARQTDRFDVFQPYLERLLGLVVEMADRLGWQKERYDALLDHYEPDTTAADVEVLFSSLRAELIDIIHRIADRRDRVNPRILAGYYPEPAQEAFCRQVLEAMGFDFQRGRLDRSAHPFTTSLGSPDDVRLTTRYDTQNFATALFGAIHEGGHGLYDQGIPREFAGTPLLGGASLGFHESQSRLWENVVGRSRFFWSHFLPLLQQAFPGQLDGVGLDAFYGAVNRVEPSLIRVEADEVTYNLHIMLRFHLERRLLEGKLRVAELPEAWNDGMEQYLGIRPPRDADGVLQDVHWAYGSFGYFPTYAIGNLLAAALWQAACRELPDLTNRISRGDLATLLQWLRQRVHVHGRKYTPKELVRLATGQPLTADPFLSYIRQKYGEIYGF